MPVLFFSLKFLRNILFNEQEYIDFLFENDILYKSRSYLYCDSSLYLIDNLFKYVNHQYHKSVSIFKNSFFAKNHLKCSDTMLIGYLWLCKASYTSIIHMIDHDYKLHKFF